MEPEIVPVLIKKKKKDKDVEGLKRKLEAAFDDSELPVAPESPKEVVDTKMDESFEDKLQSLFKQ